MSERESDRLRRQLREAADLQGARRPLAPVDWAGGRENVDVEEPQPGAYRIVSPAELRSRVRSARLDAWLIALPFGLLLGIVITVVALTVSATGWRP